MKRIVMLIAAVMCVHLTAPPLFAQHLEIEESISQHNIPKRTIESPAESSAGTSYIPKGYRGMVEMAHGVGTYSDDYLFKLSTSHGWQFNPYLYLGGFLRVGTVEDLFYVYESHGSHDFVSRPVTVLCGADFRIYMSKGKFSPFFGLLVGLNVADVHGIGVGPGFQLGARTALKGKHALNFAIEYGSPGACSSGEFLFKLGYEF